MEDTLTQTTPPQETPQQDPPLKKTYDWIRKHNSRFVRTFDEFSQDMQDEQKRLAAHKWISDNNAAFKENVPYDRWISDMGLAPKKKVESEGSLENIPGNSQPSVAATEAVSSPSTSTEVPRPDPVISQNFDPGIAKLVGLDPAMLLNANKSPEQLRDEAALARVMDPMKGAKEVVASVEQKLHPENKSIPSQVVDTIGAGAKELAEIADNPGKAILQAVPSFNKAVVSGMTAVPKTVAILANQIDRDFQTEFKDKPVEEYATFKLGKWLDEKALEWGITATDPSMDNKFFTSAIPGGLGSVASIILLGGGRSPAAPGITAQTTSQAAAIGAGVKEIGSSLASRGSFAGSIAMAVPEFEAAKKAGLSDEESFKVFLKNYGVGATEILPLAKALDRINKIQGGNLTQILKAGGQGGLEEFVQEGVQTTLTNKIAQGSYDPKRDLYQDVMKSAGAGFFVGFLLPGIAATMETMTPEQQEATKAELNNTFKSQADEKAQTPSGKQENEQKEDAKPPVSDKQSESMEQGKVPTGQATGNTDAESTNRGDVQSGVGKTDDGPTEVPAEVKSPESKIPDEKPAATPVPSEPTADLKDKPLVVERDNDDKGHWWNIRDTKNGMIVGRKDTFEEAEKFITDSLTPKTEEVEQVKEVGKKETFQNRKGKEFTVIGKNKAGDKIGVNEDGVRARLIDDRITVTQPVAMTPTAQGIKMSFGTPDEEFLTTDELKSASNENTPQQSEPGEPAAEVPKSAKEEAAPQKDSGKLPTEKAKLTEDVSDTNVGDIEYVTTNPSKSRVYSDADNNMFEAVPATNGQWSIHHKGRKTEFLAKNVDDIPNAIAELKTTLPGKPGKSSQQPAKQPAKRENAQVNSPKKVTVLKNNDNDYAVLDENGKEIGYITNVRVGDKSVYMYPAIDIEGQGYGQAAYLEMAKQFPGKQIRSGDMSPQAKKMWESLHRKGLAEKTAEDEYALKAAPAPKKSDKIKGELDDLFKDLDKALGTRNITTGVNPEAGIIGAKIVAKYVELGVVKFAEIAKDVFERYGEKAFRDYFEAMKAGYGSQLATVSDDIHATMDADVRKFKVDDVINSFNQQADDNRDTAVPDSDGGNTPQLDDGGATTEVGGTVPEEQAEGTPEPDSGASRGNTGKSRSGGSTRRRSTRDSDSKDSGTTTGGIETGSDQPQAEGRDTPTPRNVADQNHVITSEDEIVPKGDTAKINANIEAISLAKTLESENRNATPEEKKILAKYVGWGGLASVLDASKAKDAERGWGDDNWSKKYLAKHKQIVALLTDEEFDAAVNSTINAHYTDRRVITQLWDLAKRLGFKGGRVLEPSAGIGHFFGLMPQDIAQNSSLKAYELDKITGLILSKLYPEAKVNITGYENSVEGNNSQDLVISNVPFAAKAPFDKKNPDISKFSLHNYFIAKGIRQLKPGGIGIFITSSSSMDNAGASTKFREWTANEGNADFIGAIRLPNNAFKENAGTEVTTDILVYKKRTADQPGEHDLQYRNVVPVAKATTKDGKEVDIEINEYFAERPEMMLGKMALAHEVGSGGLYSADSQTLTAPANQNTEQLIADRVKKFPENIFGSQESAPEQQSVAAEVGDKEGTLKVKDGKVFMVEGGDLVDLTWGSTQFNGEGGKKYKRADVVKDYIAIKDSIRKLIDAEQSDVTDETLAPLRKSLNKAYDTFVGKYGHINRNSKLIFLEDDGEHAMVFALEDINKSIGLDGAGRIKKIYNIEKAGVFKKRVNYPVKEPTSAPNYVDAINISLSYRNKVDVPYIASMMQTSEEEARQRMLENGLVFENPVNGLLEENDSYLSGFVRTKLKEAIQANDPRYERNIKELEKVVPKDIPGAMIEFRLGSTWLPVKAMTKFMANQMGVGVKMRYSKASSSWSMEQTAGWSDQRNTITYATQEFTAFDLFEKAMNLRSPEVFRTLPDKTRVKDSEATAAAQNKLAEISDMFYNFVKGDKELMNEIEVIYNDVFNDYIEKKYTLPSFEFFPGANPDPKLKLRIHQKKAVIRALRDSTLLAHQVGTGKTMVMITIAMEQRRLGIARKPMIVVQNATLEQFAKSFKRLYPAANILAPSKKEMDSKNRQTLFNKIAYNDWDAIIIPQSFLDFIPDDQEREMGYLKDQMKELEVAMDEAKAEGDRSMTSELDKSIKAIEKQMLKVQEKGSKKTVKDTAREQLGIQRAFDRQASRRKDDVLTFEKMGVDALSLDEAHRYKKLGFLTKMGRVKGIDTGRSQTALSAFMKSRWIQEKNKGRNVVLATGTPITNTMAEVWTMMKFVAPDVLEKYDMTTFDQFATSFGLVEPSLEFTASGNFKIVSRFKSYINAPELLTAFRSKADIVLTEDVPEFAEGNTIPKLKTQPDGKPGYTRITMPQTENLKGMMKMLKEQLKAWENMSGREKRKLSYIPLLVFNRAKQAAIDLRLIDPELPDDSGSKTNKVVVEILRIFNDTNSYSGTQMVFSDMYQSPEAKEKYLDEEETIINPAFGKERFNLFEDIKKKLVKQGVPAEKIAIIHDFDSDAKRDFLWTKVSSGEVRILLGTTEKMGVGVNVQELMAGMHHIDAPPRPMDIEQRDGRIVRQGNQHAQMGKPVEIVIYGVEETLDATGYQRLAIKQTFIKQMMKGEGLTRVMKDEADEDSSSDMSFDQMMSTLSGSQYAVMHTQKMYELRKVRTSQSNYERNLIENNSTIRHNQRLIESFKKQIKEYTPAREEFKAAFPDFKFSSVTIKGKTTVNTKDTSMGQAVEQLFVEYKDKLRHVPKIEGVPIKIDNHEVRFDFTKTLNISSGEVNHVITYQIYSNGDPTVFLRGNKVTAGPGFIVSAQSIIANFVESGDDNHHQYSLDEAQGKIKKYENDIVALEAEIAKPFDKADKLIELERAVADLETKMQEETAAMEAKDKAEAEQQAAPSADKDLDEELKSLEDQTIDFTNRSAGTFDPIASMSLLPWFTPNKVKTKPANKVAEDALRDEIKMRNEEAEKRYREASGPSPSNSDSAWDGIKDSFSSMMTQFTSHFKHLNPRQFPREANLLRVFETVKKSNAESAKQYLKGLVEPLTPEQYDIFTRRIVLEDLMSGIDNKLEDPENLPFGFNSRKEVEREIQKFTDLMSKEPAAEQAYTKRQMYMDTLYDELVRRGVLFGNENRGTYYHRRVLEYLQEERNQKVIHGKKLSKAYKDWRRARTGTKGKDYSTNFIESEYRVVAEGLYEIEKQRILTDLMAPYESKLRRIKVEFNKVFKARVKEIEDTFGKGSEEVTAYKKSKRSLLKNYVEENKPEGYVYYQPTPGNALFVRKLVSQEQLENTINQAAITDQSGIGEAIQLLENITDMADPYVLVGQKRKQYLIPEPLANQLEEMGKDVEPSQNLLKDITSIWKVYVLLNPNRFIKYNINNMFGDIDGALAADPTILKMTARAWNELREFKNTGKATPDLNEAIRQNVIDSGWELTELADINNNKWAKFFSDQERPGLEDVYGKKIHEELAGILAKSPGKVWQWYWDKVKGYTRLRENLLRYAAYLRAQEKIAKGEKFYWASDPVQVDGITKPEERAGKLSREVLGDYGNISVTGERIRRYMIPFYSWMEINMSRYYRLFMNASTPAVQARIAGVAAKKGITAVAWRMIRSYAYMAMLTALVEAWNWWRFPEETEKLRRANARGMQLILTTTEDGKIITIPIVGAFYDAIDFFGLPDMKDDLALIFSGTAPTKGAIGAAKQFAIAPFEKIIGGVNPFLKSAYELMTGTQLFPDPKNPRPIYDHKEYFAQFLSLQDEYKAVTGTPTRQPYFWGHFANLVVKEIDPDELSFFMAKRIVDDHLQSKFTPKQDEKSKALYQYGLAIRYGQTEEALKYLDKYYELGGTITSLNQSLAGRNPLGRLKTLEEFDVKEMLEDPTHQPETDFGKSLTPKEIKIFRDALNYYQRTYDPDKVPK